MGHIYANALGKLELYASRDAKIDSISRRALPLCDEIEDNQFGGLFQGRGGPRWLSGAGCGAPLVAGRVGWVGVAEQISLPVL